MFCFELDPVANGGVGVAFTDRFGGVSAAPFDALNLGRLGVDDSTAIQTNIERVQAAIGASQAVLTGQVHGRDVLVVDQAYLDARSQLQVIDAWPEADAIVTTLADVALYIRTADCLPVLLADRAHGVIGAAHAGRVGLLAGVLEACVAAMVDLGATDLVAWIGPHICASCYEVPDDMADEFRHTHRGLVSQTSWGTASLDLGGHAERLLADLSVTVQREDPCTRTTPSLWSHRAQGESAGRQAGVIWRS